jgi:hypothetical protein
MRGWIASLRRLALLGLLLAAAQPARAQPPSPIAVEELLGDSVEATVECNPPGSSHVAFATSGTASGTYPGTFSEEGSVSFGPSSFAQPGAVTAFHATFTIDSGAGHITGTKALESGTAFCIPSQASGDSASVAVAGTYTATIHAPGGTFTDRGTTNLSLFAREDLPQENVFRESLSSELAAVEPLAPTSKEDCKRGGWRNYPALGFKNQGDCVSFVTTGGKNEPGKNVPGKR